MNINELKNSMIGTEFDRYVMEHTKFIEKIPNKALVILLIEGDEEFNEWSARIGKNNADEGQPIVYVTIKKMAPLRSRIEEMEVEVAEEVAAHV